MSEERRLIEKYHKELLRLTLERNKLEQELKESKELNEKLIKYIFNGGNKNGSDSDCCNIDSCSIKH